MNHVYRSIWNAASGAMVAVAENAHSHAKGRCASARRSVQKQPLLCPRTVAQLALLLLTVLATVPAGAGSLSWDANGASAGSGGSGTWDTATANWYDGVAWSAWNNAGSSDAVLNAAIAPNSGSAVAVAGAININNLTSNSAYTLTGGSLGLAAGGSTISANGGNLSIASVLSGAGSALTTAGNASVILSGANTYGGTTTISSGSLQIGAGSTSGNLGSAAVIDNGSLVLNRSNAMTVSNAISGSGNLLKSGAGTTILTGANTYAGPTTISAGILQIGAAGTSGSLGLGAVSNNATLLFNRSDTLNVANAISGTGALTQSGSGTLRLSGTNTYSGATSVTAGTLQGGAANSLSSNSALTLSAGASLDLFGNNQSIGSLSGTGGTVSNSAAVAAVLSTGSNNANGSFAGVIQDGVGTTALTKLGTATQILSGTNTYSGGTNIFSGILQLLGTTASFGTGNIIDNGTLAINRSNSFTLANAISGTGGLTRFGIGGITTILTGANTYSGTTASTGNLQIGNGGTSGTLGSGAVTITNGSLIFDRSDALTVANTISGNGALSQIGAGTTTLSGANSYSGSTTISAGVLQIGAGGSSGTLGSGAVIDTTALLFNRSNTLSVANAISGAGSLSQIGSGTTILSGANTYTGATSIAAGTLQIGAGAASGSLGTAAVSNNGSLVFNRSDAITINNVISGSGSLSQNGTGTTALTRANTYTGTTTLNAGTLQLDFSAVGAPASNIIASTSGVVFNDSAATLEVKGKAGQNGLVQSFNGISTVSGNGGVMKLTQNGATDIDVNIGALGVDSVANFVGATGSALGARIITSTNLGGNDGLTQLGGGVLWNGTNFVSIQKVAGVNYVVALAAPQQNVYTGSAGGAQVIPTSGGQNAIINLLEGGAVGAPNYLGAASTTIQSLLMTATTTPAVIAMNHNSANDTLVVGSNVAASQNGTIALTSPAQSLTIGQTPNQGFLTAGASAASTLSLTNASPSAVLSVNSVIRDNAAAGAVSLNNDNIGGGTTILAGNNTYSGTTSIGSGTLQIGAGGTSGTLGVGAVDNDANLAFNRSDTMTVANAISGEGNLKQIGSGTTILSGTNSYLGSTTISAGSLQIGAGAASGSLGNGAVIDNANLSFNRSDSATINNAISGSGSLSQSGSGTTILSGINTYSGATTVTAGTLTGGIVNAFGSNSLLSTAAGATLDLGGYNQSLGGLSGTAGTVSNSGAAATLSVGTANGATTYLGVLQDGAGQLALQKVGSGSLSLGGANTYSGATTISAGSLLAGAANAFSAQSAFSTASGASLNVAGFNQTIGSLAGSAGTVTNSAATAAVLSSGADNTSTNFAGALQNGASVLGFTKIGSGTQTLSGTNTYTGTTTISAGTLQIGAGGSSGSLGTGAVVNNATLSFNRSGVQMDVVNVISGTGNLVDNGSNHVVLSGNNTYSGTTSIGVGSVLFAGFGTATGTFGSGAIINNGSVVFGRRDTVTVANAISGSGSVTQDSQGAGTGILTLSGNNTYTGATLILHDILMGGRVNAFGLNSAVAVTSSGFLDLNGFDQAIGSLTVSADSDVSNGGSVAATLTTGSDNSSTLASGLLSDGGSASLALKKVGSGTLTLNHSNNNYSGATTVLAGTLAASAVNAFGSNSAVTMAAGATLDLGGFNQAIGSLSGSGGAISNSGAAAVTLSTGSDNSSTTFSGSISDVAGPVAVLKTGSGTQIFSATNSYSGGTTISAGTLQLGIGGSSGSMGVSSAAVLDNGVLAVNRSDAFVLNNLISGSGGISQLGSGSTSLGSANTYSGATSVMAGSLIAGVANALGSNSAVSLASAAVLDLYGNNQSIGSLAGAGGSVTSSVAGTVLLSTGGDNSSTEFAGLIQDGVASVSLTKTGSGTQILSGGNTNSGSTTISGGVLQLGNGGSSGGIGSGAVIDNAALAVNRSDSATLANAISGSGNLLQNGSGTTILTAANSYTGTTSITAGTLQVGAGGSSGSLGSGAVIDNAHLVFNRSNALTVGNAISGSGSLTQSGSGTTTLGSSNSYTGSTTLSSGTLAAGALNAFGTNSALTTAAGATLDLGGFNQTIGSLAGAGGTLTNSGATAALLTTGGDNSTSNFAGSIQDGVAATALSKVGSGTQTLSGSNTYSGATTLSNGTLAGAALNAFSSHSAVTTLAASTLDLGGFNQTIGSLAGSAGTVSNNGASAAQLSTGGDNSSVNFAGHLQDGLSAIALNKIGSGTQTLSAANSYSGLTTISAGTLQLGAGGSSGSVGSAAVIDNANLLFNRSDTATLANAISGSGSVGQNGSGTTILSGANSYAGTTTLTAGSLQVGAGGTSGSLGSGAVIDNANLLFNRSDALTVANAISGSGTLSQNGGGTTTLSSSNSYTGATLLTSGTLAAGALNAFGSNSAVSMAAGTTLDLGGFQQAIGSLAGTGGTVSNSGVTAATLSSGSDNSSSNFAGTIQDGIGTTALSKSGSGTQTLSGTNTYSGATTLNGGTLAAGAVNALSNHSAVVTAAASTLDLGGFNQAIASLAGNAGTVSNSGSNAALLSLGSDNSSSKFGGTIQDGVSLTALTKVGSGTQTLSGSNTYTGATTVSGGTLLLDFSAPAAAVANILASSSSLILQGGTIEVKGVSTANGLLESFQNSNSGAGTFKLSQNGAQDIDVNLGALSSDSATNFVGASGVTRGARFITSSSAGANDAQTQVAGGALWNGTSFASIQDVSGVHYLVQLQSSQQNVFTDPASGSIVIPDIPAHDAIVTIQNGGPASSANQLAAAVTTLQSLLMSASTAPSTIAMSQNSANDTLVIGSNVANSQNGTIAIATTAQSLSVGQVANQGFLTAGSSGASAVNLSNASASSVLTVNSVISDNAGAGAVALNVSNIANGTTILAGDNTYSGATIISAGTLQVGAGGSSGSLGSAAVTNNANLSFDRSNTLLVSNAISGTGSLNQIGSGTTVLSGANTYSGATTVSNGTLAAGAVDVFGSNSAVTTAAGATLDLGGFNQAIGSLAGTGGTVTNSGATVAAMTIGGNNSSANFAGTIQDGVSATALTKVGSGTQTLSGSNTYSGATTVSNGTLS
ncbi:autotransporter-associated beta strand repeat-containing protein, partial [Undibacterium sp. CCC3.4]